MPAEPSPEQLQAAWQHLRGRPGWPAALRDAMQHPVYSRLLKLTALHPPRAARTAPTPVAAPSLASNRPRPVAPRRQAAVATTAPLFDHKRAAAGDRDDD